MTTPKKPGFQELVDFYTQREAVFSPNDVEIRLNNFRNAHAMSELNGAGALPKEFEIAMQLRAEGKITDKEYLRLCELTIPSESMRLSAPSP